MTTQPSLFGSRPAGRIDVGDDACRVWLVPDAIHDANRLLAEVLATTPWEQHHRTMYGARHPTPRLESWHADPGCGYAYSGTSLVIHPWTAALLEIRGIVEAQCAGSFNSVLCNRYRDGADRVGWHADDEDELGPHPTIASVSLGATRRFRLRAVDDGHTIALDLEHGSLLLMAGATQERFRHELTATSRAVGERVNLTYRTVRQES